MTSRIIGLLAVGLLLIACAPAPAAVAPPAAPSPPAAAPQTAAPPTPAPTVAIQPIAGGPVLLRAGIELREVRRLGAGALRLARSPRDGAIYLLTPGGVSRVDLEPPALTVVAPMGAIADATPTGLAFAPNGDLYVVANRTSNLRTQAIVRRGTPTESGSFAWTTLLTTEPYATSGTPFDHQFNGIVVSPDGRWVYLNSGSRTDHGELQGRNGAFPEAREIALTSKIFRVPAAAADLTLPNDEAQLTAAGQIFAWGTRNAYDLAFAPNGDLFGIDNGPDADYPDELNWLQEGRHYGFPWRFGSQDNPQATPGYDPRQDKLLHPDFTAVKTFTYYNDPGFPPPPGPFTDPVVNRGPAAAQYRAADGSQRDATAEGATLTTFTPHRSPLGLAFVNDEPLPAPYAEEEGTLSAFLVSWGSAGGTLTDRGQDLLHLRLTREGDTYTAVTEQIARDFKNPIDALLIDNRLYILEFGGDGTLWELTFR